MQVRAPIKKIKSINDFVYDIKRGDTVFFDIDDVILLTGTKRTQHVVKSAEPGVATAVRYLQERGIKTYGFSLRQKKYAKQTIQQLKSISIELDDIIYIPRSKDDKANFPVMKGKLLQKYFQRLGVNMDETRMVIIDNNITHLKKLDSLLATFKIPYTLYQYKRPLHQSILPNQKDNLFFPENLKPYSHVTSINGNKNQFNVTNPASKESLLVNFGVSSNAIKIEILCAILYQVLGVLVPKTQAYNTLPPFLTALGNYQPLDIVKVSEIVINSPHKKIEKLILDTVKNNFIAYALLGNINVANRDNFVVTSDNHVYLINTETNFLFKTLGVNREEDPSVVNEIDDLRDMRKNKEAHRWFSSLTDDDIEFQVKSLIKVLPQLEKTAWEVSSKLNLPETLQTEFLQYLADRIDVIIERFCPDEYLNAKIDKKSQGKFTSAGMLSYAMIDGIPHVLLVSKDRHGWWGHFGGKSIDSDTYLYETVKREVSETSEGLFSCSIQQLRQSPFHDVMTKKDGRWFTYRLYLVEEEYDDKCDEKQHHFIWVPLKSVLLALYEENIEVENQQTVAFMHQHNEIILYPSLYQMLLQPQVIFNLKRLVAGKTVKQTHTRGTLERSSSSSHSKETHFFSSPELQRQQVVETVVNHAAMLSDFKQKMSEKNTLKKTKIASSNQLSQSELHLKSILKNKYKTNKTKANVQSLFTSELSKLTSHLSAEKKKNLVNGCVRFIEREKEDHQQYFYFYHSCDEKLSFVYQVYTKIHHFLQARHQWFSLRGSHFDELRFKNIIEFIDHYTKDNHNTRSDFSLEDNEYTLSANPFLFGNYNQATPNSILSVLKNNTFKKFDLAKLFENVFKEFSMNTDAIKPLLMLFEQYFKNSGNVLYQVGIPHVDIEKNVCPVKSSGKVNSYKKSRNMQVVLKRLEKDMANKKLATGARQYMESLQLKVLVPTHQSLTVHELRVLEIKHYDKFNSTLNNVIKNMLYSIFGNLTFYNINRFNDKAPTLKLLRMGFERNNLSYTSHYTERTLVKAILNNNANLVRKMLTEQPILKNQQLSYPTEYSGSTILRADKDTPFVMMVAFSDFPLQLFKDCYGSQWVDLLENGYGLVAIMSHIPLQERFAFAKEHKYFIKTSEQLDLLLGQLPVVNRLRFAKLCHTVVQYDVELVTLLNRLPMKDRAPLAEKLMHTIWTGYQLATVIKMLPAKNRLTFAMNVKSGKSHGVDSVSGDGLIEVLKLLAKNERLTLLLSGHRLLSWCEHEKQICTILQLLPKNERLCFAQEIRHYIKNSNMLNSVCKLLPTSDVTDYANQFIDEKIFLPEVISQDGKQMSKVGLFANSRLVIRTSEEEHMDGHTDENDQPQKGCVIS